MNGELEGIGKGSTVTQDDVSQTYIPGETGESYVKGFWAKVWTPDRLEKKQEVRLFGSDIVQACFFNSLMQVL